MLKPPDRPPFDHEETAQRTEDAQLKLGQSLRVQSAANPDLLTSQTGVLPRAFVLLQMVFL